MSFRPPHIYKYEWKYAGQGPDIAYEWQKLRDKKTFFCIRGTYARRSRHAHAMVLSALACVSFTYLMNDAAVTWRKVNNARHYVCLIHAKSPSKNKVLLLLSLNKMLKKRLEISTRSEMNSFAGVANTYPHNVFYTRKVDLRKQSVRSRARTYKVLWLSCSFSLIKTKDAKLVISTSPKKSGGMGLHVIDADSCHIWFLESLFTHWAQEQHYHSRDKTIFTYRSIMACT